MSRDKRNLTNEEKDAFVKILRMLLSSDYKEYDPDGEGKELLEWLKTSWKKQTDDVLPDGFHVRVHQSNCNNQVLLFSILRECMISHRWKEALKTLIAIASQPTRRYHNGLLILRVGLELMMQLGGNAEMLDSLILNVKSLQGIGEKQACVDHFLFNIAQRSKDGIHASASGLNHFTEIAQVLKKATQKKRGAKRRIISMSEKQVDNCLDSAYSGFASYVKWSLTMLELEAIEEGLDPVSKLDLNRKQRLRDEMKLHAQAAISKLEVVHHEKGVWDIFVSKHLELLEYLAEGDVLEDGIDYLGVAQNMLQNYAKANPTNPNVWRYLYIFYKRHNFSDELRIGALNKIYELVPSDELVIDLLSESKITTERLPMLFNLLDFFVWKDDERLWSLLANEFLVALSLPDDEPDYCSCVDVINDLWSSRSDFWPNYHFVIPIDLLSEKRTITSDIEIYKAVAAHVLLGKENKYTRTIKQLARKVHPKRESYAMLKKVRTFSKIVNNNDEETSDQMN